MITYFDEPLELIAKFEEIKGSGRVICIFSGSENAQGKNWCPDCDAAKPMIQKLIP
jgi:thiol-disulfide isomerase/thioredoxin